MLLFSNEVTWPCNPYLRYYRQYFAEDNSQGGKMNFNNFTAIAGTSVNDIYCNRNILRKAMREGFCFLSIPLTVARKQGVLRCDPSNSECNLGEGACIFCWDKIGRGWWKNRGVLSFLYFAKHWCRPKTPITNRPSAIPFFSLTLHAIVSYFIRTITIPFSQ